MTTDAPKKSYKDTLNLPQTDFPMEAKLVQNEPSCLQQWRDANLYQQVLDARRGRKNGCCTTARRSPTATSTSGT